ncbi:hypothetical protein [Umezawaea tangerina]|uniref:Centromere-binding protein ParB C-terminal domain-containing protein n=1 Tax=Umezawaea tangerina TaxID=84725 RepID=A0A2T0TMG6_9PSEU|nr:hypothetical protein [Umezawaea tangerina]PRY46914.1 hypothetical protein CLV43_1011196 [Umezawaea tangerina]
MTLPPETAPDTAAEVKEITVSTAELGTAEATGGDRQTGRRVQRTINFDSEVLERARAAATYLSAYEPSAGVRSLADIVNPAVEEYVGELERKFNDGTPFRPVYRMPPGRPSRRG